MDESDPLQELQELNETAFRRDQTRTKIGVITAIHEDGDQRFEFTDLLPNVKIHHSRLVSVTLERTQGSPTGFLRGRVINDAGRGHLYRRDNDGTTEFFVEWGDEVRAEQ